MTLITATVDFESELFDWLSQFCQTEDMSFSAAMNMLLQFGVRVAEQEIPLPEENISKHQKLMTQCLVECLLILQDFHADEPDYKAKIREQATRLIKNTLKLEPN